MKTSEEKQLIFNDEAIRNFSAFSIVLKRIHTRLIGEGCTIEDGKLKKPAVDNFSRGCDKVGVETKKP